MYSNQRRIMILTALETTASNVGLSQDTYRSSIMDDGEIRLGMGRSGPRVSLTDVA